MPVFWESGGKKFADILPTQQALTDKKIEELRAFCAVCPLKEAKTVKNDIDLDSVLSMRKKINNLTSTTKDAVRFYTSLNKKLIDTISYFSTIPEDAKVRTAFSSYVIFISLEW